MRVAQERNVASSGDWRFNCLILGHNQSQARYAKRCLRSIVIAKLLLSDWNTSRLERITQSRLLCFRFCFRHCFSLLVEFIANNLNVVFDCEFWRSFSENSMEWPHAECSLTSHHVHVLRFLWYIWNKLHIDLSIRQHLTKRSSQVN